MNCTMMHGSMKIKSNFTLIQAPCILCFIVCLFLEYYVLYTRQVSRRGGNFKQLYVAVRKSCFFFLHFRYFTKNIVMCIRIKLWLLVSEYPNELPCARGVTPHIYMLISYL